jgi:predicted transcriptional regulator
MAPPGGPFASVIRMKTLEIPLSDEIAAQIEQVARERGVSVEDLVRSGIVEKLEREAQFDSTAEQVLSRNAELYKRLA